MLCTHIIYTWTLMLLFILSRVLLSASVVPVSMHWRVMSCRLYLYHSRHPCISIWRKRNSCKILIAEFIVMYTVAMIWHLLYLCIISVPGRVDAFVSIISSSGCFDRMIYSQLPFLTTTPPSDWLEGKLFAFSKFLFICIVCWFWFNTDIMHS